MKQHILQTILGLTITFFGIVAGFNYIYYIETPSLILLVLSVLLIIIGLVLLFRTGRKDDHIPKFKEQAKSEITPDKKSLINQNKEMSSLYHRTEVTRDKLKILKRLG